MYYEFTSRCQMKTKLILIIAFLSCYIAFCQNDKNEYQDILIEQDSINIYIKYRTEISIYDTNFMKMYVENKKLDSTSWRLLKFQGINVNLTDVGNKGFLYFKIFTPKTKDFVSNKPMIEFMPTVKNKGGFDWVVNLYTKPKYKVKYAHKAFYKEGESFIANLSIEIERPKIGKFTTEGLKIKLKELVYNNAFIDNFMKKFKDYDYDGYSLYLEKLVHCPKVINYIPSDSLIACLKVPKISDAIKFKVVSLIKERDVKKYETLSKLGIRDRSYYIENVIEKIITKKRLSSLEIDTRLLKYDAETLDVIIKLYDKGKFKGNEEKLKKFIVGYREFLLENSSYKKKIENRLGVLK